MKYYVLCTLALLLCMGLGAAVVFPLLRNKRKAFPKLLLSLLLGLLLACAAGLLYLSFYYRASPDALRCLSSGENVTVSEIGKGYYFDGPGEEAALVFYPGAKVESEAYAPLLQTLAREGLDCFLVKMPLHMAVLDADAAEELRAAYDYDSWLLAGHSMGGAVAANLVGDGAGFDALVLLASYPTKALPERLRLLSVYGSEDGCLDREQYEAGRQFWPEQATELVISGGNHASFGNYGAQRGDGAAVIGAWEQQALTAGAILDLLG